LIVWEALIQVIQRSYDYFSRFLPWLVIAPIYFAKEVDFGVFGQASIAFSQVLFSVSYIVNNIDRLAAFSASISRLEGFQGKVEAISGEILAQSIAEQVQPPLGAESALGDESPDSSQYCLFPGLVLRKLYR